MMQVRETGFGALLLLPQTRRVVAQPRLCFVVGQKQLRGWTGLQGGLSTAEIGRAGPRQRSESHH